MPSEQSSRREIRDWPCLQADPRFAVLMRKIGFTEHERYAETVKIDYFFAGLKRYGRIRLHSDCACSAIPTPTEW